MTTPRRGRNLGSGIDEDYTTVHLRGSQSLYMPINDRTDSVSFSTTTEAWGHFLYEITDTPSYGPEIFQLYNGTTKLARITQNTNGTFNVKAEGGAAV